MFWAAQDSFLASCSLGIWLETQALWIRVWAVLGALLLDPLFSLLLLQLLGGSHSVLHGRLAGSVICWFGHWDI